MSTVSSDDLRVHASTTCETDLVVTLLGDLDAGTAAILGDVLMAADACDTTSVQLDMSGVDFIDSSGLSVLVSGDRHLRRSGGGLTVVNPSASVASLLALTALEVRIDLSEGAS